MIIHQLEQAGIDTIKDILSKFCLDNEANDLVYKTINEYGLQGTAIVQIIDNLQREFRLQPGLYGTLKNVEEKYIGITGKPILTSKIKTPLTSRKPTPTPKITSDILEVVGPSGKVWHIKRKKCQFVIKGNPNRFWTKGSDQEKLHNLLSSKPQDELSINKFITDNNLRIDLHKFLYPYKSGDYLRFGWNCEIDNGALSLQYNDPETGKYKDDVLAMKVVWEKYESHNTT